MWVSLHGGARGFDLKLRAAFTPPPGWLSGGGSRFSIVLRLRGFILVVRSGAPGLLKRISFGSRLRRLFKGVLRRRTWPRHSGTDAVPAESPRRRRRSVVALLRGICIRSPDKKRVSFLSRVRLASLSMTQNFDGQNFSCFFPFPIETFSSVSVLPFCISGNLGGSDRMPCISVSRPFARSSGRNLYQRGCLVLSSPRSDGPFPRLSSAMDRSHRHPLFEVPALDGADSGGCLEGLRPRPFLGEFLPALSVSGKFFFFFFFSDFF